MHHGKNQQQPTRAGKMSLELLYSLILRELSLFTLGDCSLEEHIFKIAFIWPDLELAQWEKPFSQECLSAIETEILTSHMLKAGHNSWEEQYINQNV